MQRETLSNDCFQRGPSLLSPLVLTCQNTSFLSEGQTDIALERG